MYGAQAVVKKHFSPILFENDVEMYGAQAYNGELEAGKV